MQEYNSFASKNAVYTDEASGVEVNVECIVGGDMKYLLTIFGLSMATASFPCLYCERSKTEFHQGMSERKTSLSESVSLMR